MSVGERESGTGKLEEAVAAFREALKEQTRERVPLEWAATQNNLGNALTRLGERESGTGKLEQAVAAYREALKEWTRERAPAPMGGDAEQSRQCALYARGARERDGASSIEAVAAYREALKEYTRERVPLQWATTQNNLGAALQRARGARERDGQTRRGGRGLWRGAEGMDARARSAPMGGDADEISVLRSRGSASATAGKSNRFGVWRRRSRPLARR